MSAVQSLSLVGGVVPPSLVDRIIAGEVSDRSSLSARSYHLVGTETVRDAASRAWGYLRGAWVAWREHDAAQRVGAGTGPARERWLLPLLRELGYGQVPALPSGLSVEGTDYPVSHRWEHVPVHLLGPGVDLDRRNPGVSGAARAPQSMLQELLNRSDEHLWGLLSNGLRLRLLRDSTSLAGSAYVEFDLEAIFEGELYAEWLLLFQLCHVSRVEKRGGAEASAADCWLESWRGEAVEAGGRALDKLRWGVEQALNALGEGFLSHRENRWLVVALRSGELSDRDLHRALLRLVYRMLFVFVAEDRDLLLAPGDAEGRDRYERFFSTSRLRHVARVRTGGPHADMWQAQRLVLAGLGGDGIPQLALPALGGVFDPDWRAVVPAAAPDQQDLLLGAELSNQHFLTAVRALAWVQGADGRLQRVDYRNLGAEELGSVYESLLELVPSVDLDERSFTLTHLAGNERKTTGSYYTPPALVSALLDTALDPVIDDAVRGVTDAVEAERRLLALTVCDPACGSGGFLVAAARRIAQRLARVRCGDDEPTPAQVHHAMRDVVGRCIYGVDLNDLAAELAKVSLWLEAMDPGKPLGFLDARIRVGNALLGATPALLAGGVPDVAFKELLGDDKTYAAQIRKRNRAEGGGQDLLFSGISGGTAELAQARRRLIVTTDDIDASRRQAQAWAEYEQSAALRRARLHADAWCAAFVWPLKPGVALPPTNAVLRQLEQDPTDPGLADIVGQVQNLTHQYQFFHWHLEFPEVFGDPTSPAPHGPEGWPGGFSCVLGNPPWERVKLQEQEFFAARDPQIAKAPNAAARGRLIKALEEKDPSLYVAFTAAKRNAEGQSAFLRLSGRYPLNGRGDVNTYAVFTELFRSLTGPRGQSGVIAPTGIATDATTQYFFKDLVTTASLVALYDFENARPIFDGVHRSFKFCLLTMSGRSLQTPAASFAFFLHDPGDIASSEFELTPEEITLLNPNTGTCPIFRTRRDAEITLGIYRRVPVLIKEGDPDGNPWGISFMTMFHMSNDSHLFHTREELEDDGWVLEGNVFVKNAGGGGDSNAAPA